MENSKDLILSIDNLTLDFETEKDTVHALSDISLKIHQGETVGLVGESGCGKSTVAKAVMRLLSDNSNIKSGTIDFKGKDILKLSKEEMRRVRGNDITLIFQDPMTALNPVQKVGSQIADVLKAHKKMSKKDITARVQELMELVGIDGDRYKEYPHQFSGGMRQRIVIAIALACDPDLLIADEPTTALDVTIQAEILDLIKDIQQQKNTAMLLISHDLGVIAETCNYVAVLYAGQIVEYGSIEQVFNNTLHPYTAGLFGAIPEISDDVERLSPIRGNIADASDLPDGCYFASRCDFATEECKKGVIPLKTLPDGHQCRCLRCTEINCRDYKPAGTNVEE